MQTVKTKKKNRTFYDLFIYNCKIWATYSKTEMAFDSFTYKYEIFLHMQYAKPQVYAYGSRFSRN